MREVPAGINAYKPTTAYDKSPENEFQALMECAPGEHPRLSISEEVERREAVCDAIDRLDERDRFIIEAVAYERLSFRQLAVRLGFKSHSQPRLLYNEALGRLKVLIEAGPPLPPEPEYDIYEIAEPTLAYDEMELEE